MFYCFKVNTGPLAEWISLRIPRNKDSTIEKKWMDVNNVIK